MKCPSCGAENPDDYRFCARCGTDMTSVPEPEPETKVDGIGCPKCGNMNPPGYGFCGKCGRRLDPVAVPEEPVEENHTEAGGSGPTPKPSKPKGPNGKRNAVIAVALVLIVAVAAIAVFAMGSHDDPPDRPLDWLETPDGTYTYDIKTIDNGTTQESVIAYTLNNGTITSCTIDGVALTASQLDELREEAERLRGYSYSYKDGPIWNDGARDYRSYKVDYKGISIDQYISEDGHIIFEKSYKDNVTIIATLSGWSQGNLQHVVELDWGVVGKSWSHIKHGESFVIPGGDHSREGYKLTGWFDRINNVTYGATETIPHVNTDLSLVAQWEHTLVNVTWDANGGYGTKAVTVEYGSQVTAPNSDTVTRDGYELRGWSTRPDSTTPEYGIVYTFAAETDLKLYAVWVELHTVKYNVGPQGGITFGSSTVADGTPLRLNQFPYSMKGFAFECWLKDGERYDGNTPVTSDITLYAKWVQVVEVEISGRTVTLTNLLGMPFEIYWGDNTSDTDVLTHTYDRQNVETAIVIKTTLNGKEVIVGYEVRIGEWPGFSVGAQTEPGCTWTVQKKEGYLYSGSEDIPVTWILDGVLIGTGDRCYVNLTEPGFHWLIVIGKTDTGIYGSFLSVPIGYIV